jgi:hypothetical protein
MTFHYLYKITHTPSGKYYHGRHSFKSLDNKYLGSGRWVTSIIDKSTLQKEILQIFETQEELIEAETAIIRENWDDPLQMNWNDSGVGWSSATNPSKINHPWKGRSHSEETKQKVSETKKQQYASGEVIHPWKGRSHSEESKEKQRQKMRGRKLTPEHKQKIGESGKGRKQTEAQKESARTANQKEWFIWYPDGHYEIITNLRQFALENGLDQGCMTNVAAGRLLQHKGFRAWRF